MENTIKQLKGVLSTLPDEHTQKDTHKIGQGSFENGNSNENHDDGHPAEKEEVLKNDIV